MMKSGHRYRITAPTIAVTIDKALGHDVAITIPEGGIVEITDAMEASGFLHVRWEGKECEMFTQDLQERGELVKIVVR